VPTVAHLPLLAKGPRLDSYLASQDRRQLEFASWAASRKLPAAASRSKTGYSAYWNRAARACIYDVRRGASGPTAGAASKDPATGIVRQLR